MKIVFGCVSESVPDYFPYLLRLLNFEKKTLLNTLFKLKKTSHVHSVVHLFQLVGGVVVVAVNNSSYLLFYYL